MTCYSSPRTGTALPVAVGTRRTGRIYRGRTRGRGRGPGRRGSEPDSELAEVTRPAGAPGGCLLPTWQCPGHWQWCVPVRPTRPSLSGRRLWPWPSPRGEFHSAGNSGVDCHQCPAGGNDPRSPSPHDENTLWHTHNCTWARASTLPRRTTGTTAHTYRHAQAHERTSAQADAFTDDTERATAAHIHTVLTCRVYMWISDQQTRRN